jgi:drug/metabolite transporter (DMT)-like permease
MPTKAAVVLAILAAVLFGIATPASKWLLVDLTPFQLAGLLYLGAALAVAPSALRQGNLAQVLRSDRKTRMRLLGAVVFGGMLGPLALLFGLQLAQATSVSLWLNLELAATAALGAFVFRDHLSRRGWLGIAAALLASSLLAWGSETAGFAPGALILLSCLCWGLDNHLTALIDGISPSQSTFCKGAVAGTVNLAIGATLAPISVEGADIILAALLLGALSYGASIVLYIRSAQAIGATRAQVLFASAPFFGVAVSVAALGESVSMLHAVAAALFIVGAVLLLIEGHTHEHTHEAMTHEHAHRHDDDHHHTHVHPGLPAWVRHTHRHDHIPSSHGHPHWPDLHHRHRHKESVE